MSESEVIAAWRATACHLLEPWVMDPVVTKSLVARLGDKSPLVREAAARVLVHPARNQHTEVRAALQRLLEDSIRSVRVAAAWGLVDTLDLSSRAGRELVHMLDINADQPTGRMRLSQFAYHRGDPQTAIRQIRKAIEWDPNSPPFHHDLALLLNSTGDNVGAIAALQDAIRLDGDEAEYHYKLALALAETGDLAGTVSSLEKTVELDARNARAWYNLGLAYNSRNEPQRAIEALRRGEAAGPSDYAIPYARATIHARLGQRNEAMEAAVKAMQLNPESQEVRQLLQNLAR